MNNKLPIILLDESTAETVQRSSRMNITEMKLDVAGELLPVRIGVRNGPAKLADIAPMARALSSKITDAGLRHFKRNGVTVLCRKGCSACCNYLIPLSVPEVFRLREELLAMPTDYNSRILQSCLDTAERILDSKPQTSYLKSLSKSGRSRISQISKWYAGLKLACPFLSDDLCMLYEQRPLACREHIVIGSNVSCKTNHRGKPNVVPVPVSVLGTVGQLTAELENLDIEAVMLPLAFPWAQDNLPRAERIWPAVTMVKRFVEILKNQMSN